MIKALLGITILSLTGPPLEKTTPNLVKGLGLVYFPLNALLKRAHVAILKCAIYCAGFVFPFTGIRIELYRINNQIYTSDLLLFPRPVFLKPFQISSFFHNNSVKHFCLPGSNNLASLNNGYTNTLPVQVYFLNISAFTPFFLKGRGDEVLALNQR